VIFVSIDAAYTDAPFTVPAEEIILEQFILDMYVKGSGSYDEPGVGKKTDWSFGGRVNVARDGGLVGNYRIMNHMTKTTYRTTSFTFLWFPENMQGRDEAVVSGTFVDNKGGTEITLTLYIWDNDNDLVYDEEDFISIKEGGYQDTGAFWIPWPTETTPIDELYKCNFQILWKR
jgi:hypothetical protein